MKVAPGWARSTGGSWPAADPRKSLAACDAEILTRRNFDDLECRDLLHAGRAGFGYGLSAFTLA